MHTNAHTREHISTHTLIAHGQWTVRAAAVRKVVCKSGWREHAGLGDPNRAATSTEREMRAIGAGEGGAVNLVHGVACVCECQRIQNTEL